MGHKIEADNTHAHNCDKYVNENMEWAQLSPNENYL